MRGIEFFGVEDIFLGGGEQKFSLNGDLIIWSMEKLGSAFFFFFGAEKYFWEGGMGKKILVERG